MGKKIVVSFPGGRGYEIPLLYFGAKHFEDRGYEKVFVSHPGYGDYSFEELLDNAERRLSAVDFKEYEEVVFVAKSIGAGVACAIKEKYQLTAELVLFTPLQETLPYVSRQNNIKLVALGEKDRYIDYHLVKELCEKEGIPCYVEPGVGHRMEVMGDLTRNLEVISNVIRKLDTNE